LNDPCSVLIVDRSEETREVLQTVLERRGVKTMAVGKMGAGMEIARRHHPDLVVLDLECEDVPSERFSECFSAQEEPSFAENSAKDAAGRNPPPQMILLGSLRGISHQLPPGEIVRKPYHYGLLIRKIEELLERKGNVPEG
jgi:CheY-like chemotaxis protein